MPKPEDGETEKDFIDRCIPMVIEEGTAKDGEQGAAICHSMWDEHMKKKSITSSDFQLKTGGLTNQASREKDEPETLYISGYKIGARNNSEDARRLQMIHDLTIENGAACPKPQGEIVNIPFTMSEAVVAYGEPAIKVLGQDGSKVKVGGYLVRFSGEADPDLTGEFFHKGTDFGVTFPCTTKTWFNHCMPVKGRAITKEFTPGELTIDDIGVFFTDVLDEADEYDAMVLELTKKNKIGLSSGTAPHLIKYTPMEKAVRIDRWPLGLDASYTHQPSEPRNRVVPLKSLLEPEGGETARGTAATNPESLPVSTQERGIKMEYSPEEIQKLISETSQAAAQATLKALEAEPAVKKAGVAVVEDEADRALKGNPFTFGTFLQAVAKSSQDGERDIRLKPLKAASGMNETIPSQGGYLLQPQFAEGIFNKLYPAGSIMDKINWTNLGPNANEFVVNLIDETSRVDGSRYGGLQGYWLAEAASKTASKPKLRQARVQAHKVAALCYATDELLADAVQLESWMTREVPNELRFKIEDAIYGGDGVGKPMGWIESPSRKIVARDTASKVLAVDVFGMWTALWPACRPTSQWYCGPDTEAQLLQLYLQSGIAFPWYTIGPDGVTRIFGRPLNVVEYCATLNTAGDIILVDPTQYIGVRKGDVQAASSIHVLFTTDESTFRFVARVGGEDSWHSTLTAHGGSATLSDIVMLGSATATTT